jgi:hypothetical protein
MMKMRRASTHALARVLLKGQEKPIRSRTFGRYIIMWDGKPGDYRETASTEELFGPSVAKRVPSEAVLSTATGESADAEPRGESRPELDEYLVGLNKLIGHGNILVLDRVPSGQERRESEGTES